MTREDYEILSASMKPGVKIPDYALKLLEDTCLRTGLDWKLRHVYLMERGGKWQVTLSIDGFRATGARSPEYAGQVGPLWVVAADGAWTDIPPDGAIYASKVGVEKKGGIITWGVAKYKDYAAGPMWSKFPSTMIAKCAEMLAWRKAFPGIFGGLYGTEEMGQAEKPNSADGASSPMPSLPATEVDKVKNNYILKLTKALNKDDLIAIGKAISADKSLQLADTLELHKTYTELKAKYD